MRKLLLALLVVAVAPSGLFSQPVPSRAWRREPDGPRRLVLGHRVRPWRRRARRGRQRRRRGGRDGLRAWRSRIRSPATSAAAASWSSAPRAARPRRSTIARPRPGKSTPTMYLGADGKIERSAHRDGLSGARRARHGARHGARAQAIRQAAVEGRRHARRRARGEGIRDVGVARARTVERGRRADEAVPRVGRRVRQARRRSVGGGRSARAADLAKSLQAIATDGPDVFYTGWIADRIAEDMAANGGLITKADLAAYQAKERAPITARSSATTSSRCRRRARAASRSSRC